MPNKKIIAIVGMAGSGKSEVVNYLQKKLKCPKIYFGEATFKKMKKEGMELNYKNERLAREKIRAELGMGAYAVLALPKAKKLLKTNDIILLESMYSWDEYKIFKKKYKNNFKVIAIYASPDTRFKRISQRKSGRPIKSREEFIKRDYTEIENTDKGGPIARADFTIVNEKNLNELYKQIDKIDH